MNINQSIADWVTTRRPEFASLTGMQILTMGDTGDQTPPFLGIYETASATHETNGVMMHGVTDFEITAELHTVPADEDNDGTAPDVERQMRRDLYDILGDRFAIDWLASRNGWAVFDIRLSSPTTEANEGRRISKFILTVIACPN